MLDLDDSPGLSLPDPNVRPFTGSDDSLGQLRVERDPTLLS